MPGVTAIDTKTMGISSLCSPAVRRRVLVCEDDPSIRTMVSAVLGRGDFDVITVSDGEETIARLDEPFDVMILDLMMPNKSGYDVLRHIQQTNAKLLERVILVTAHAAIRRQPLEVPVAAVLIKPFDIGEFMTAVRRTAGES